MALGTSNYGQRGEIWEPQNEELAPETKYEGEIFEFRCWEAKDGKDYVSFGFLVDGKKVQRFYGLTTKKGHSKGWILESDLRTILGKAPEVDQVQTPDGRTGPIKSALVGKKVSLSYETRDGWLDLYIDGPVLSDPAAGW